MMNRSARVALAAAITIAVLGCAGGPAITSRRVPEWVLEPPASDAGHERFVVSASGPSVVAAEEAAGYALLSQINQALGVEITVETSAEARSTLDSYEAELVQQVTQRGSGQVEGLRVADRYIGEQADGYMVYLLGEYERAAFDAERAKRRAILRQQEELLTGPESAGDELARSGRLTLAIMQYANAAIAAAGSDIRIAPILLERVLQKAADSAALLELAVVSGPVTAEPGVGVAEPIIFRLSDEEANPVPSAAVEISFVGARGNRDFVRTESMFTDREGFVAFMHPAPHRVGDFTVTARLDLQSLPGMLDDLPQQVDNQTRAVADLLANVRATHRFVALSRARTIPTGVVIVELDASGGFMSGDLTSGGVTEALTQSGFQLRSVQIEPRRLLNMSTAESVRFLQERVNADLDRIILGEARIAEVRDDDGVLVKVSGTVAAVDLVSGTVLYSTSGIKNVRSQTLERAINTAFAELGRQLGLDLASNLP